MEEMKTSISSSQAYNRSNLLGQDGVKEPEGLDNSGSIMKGSTSLLKKSNDVGLNQVQICTSLNNTESVKSAMIMAVNSVRAAACEGECRYVASQNTKKMTMEIQIREEDIACKEKLEQILRKWQELMSCKAPQELAHQISEQCKACDDLIQSKKSLVELIRGELKVIDEDYHRMFRQQAKDVDMLVFSMGSQVVDLHNTHIDELSTIENDFLAQRKDLLLRNKAEIDALLKKVRTKENVIKDNLLKRLEDYTKSLDTTRTQDNEDYNLLKVRLETDIQTLEQHLESMGAAYQLNTEKLDYNYAVLVERDHDNYVTAGQQKRKLTKQRDTLCTLKARHGDYEKRFLLQNGKLSNDYEKIIRLLQDLQSKEHQLQAAQERQHWEFLHMHHRSLAVLASKLLQADKMIHEQQLGWLWHPPPKDIFLSFEEKVQEEHAPIRFESCQVSRESSDDMQITRSDEQIKTDESTGSFFVRSSPKDVASYQPKAGKLPSIVEMEKIWRSYSELIAPKVLHVWAAFAAALVSYNQLLKNRAKVMHEVYLLSQEKKVLQGALEYCMSSKAGVQRVVKS